MGSHRNPIPVDIQARVTKFYVSNLPDRCSGVDLASAIRSFGTIFDIYIARKRDKVGKRFGFVSLLDVKDRDETVKQLSQIKLGDFRLKCNVARFVLEDGEINDRKSEKAKPSFKRYQQGSEGVKRGGVFGMGGNLSFKEAFTGVNPNKVVEVDENFRAFESEIGRALIIGVSSFEVLKNVRSILKEMGLASGKIRCLGGFMLMVIFKKKDHATMARDELLGRPEMFSSVDYWEGQDLRYERVAWLKVYGLPICVMDNKVIDDVGRLFGTVVRPAQIDLCSEDASFHYVGVLVAGSKLIHEEAYVRWRKKTFKIWVMEETKEWMADCLRNEEDDMHDQRDDFGKRMSMDESCGRSGSNPATASPASPKFGKEVTGPEDRNIVTATSFPTDGNSKRQKEVDETLGSGRDLHGDSQALEQEASGVKLVDAIVNKAGVIGDTCGVHQVQDSNMDNPSIIGLNKYGTSEVEPETINGYPLFDGMYGINKVGDVEGINSHTQQKLTEAVNTSPEQNDGETPIPPSMGKRSRNLRSPPSLGSTQAPPTRVCYGDFSPGSKPNDLNSTENQPVDSGVEDVRSQVVQVQADEALGEQTHMESNALLGGSGEQFSSGENATAGSHFNQQKIGPIFCFGSREKLEQIINGAINGQNYSLGSTEKEGQRGEKIRKKWSRRMRNPGQQDQVSEENGGVYNNTRNGGDNVGR